MDLKPKSLIKQEVIEQSQDNELEKEKEPDMDVDTNKGESTELDELFPSLSLSVLDENANRGEILRGLFPELVVYTLENSSNKGSAASPVPTSHNSPALGEPRVIPLLLSKKDRPQLAQTSTKVYAGPGTSRFLTGKPIIYSALPGTQWKPSPDQMRLKAGNAPNHPAGS